MSLPKISVIVPIYNVEPYLDRCVKSIVGQTYKNLEIILVDDGSTDGSSQICDEWQKRDERVVVIHKTNGGVSDARNFGLDKVTGDYFSFIDSDDFVTDDYIETLYNICAEHGCDIAQCYFVEVYNDDVVHCAKEDNVRIFDNVQMLYNFYTDELYIQTCIVCNKLFKKHLFENIRFRTGIRYEDEQVILPIMYNAKRIAVSSKCGYMYYQRDDSFMKSAFSRENLDVIEVFEEHIHFFDALNFNILKEIAVKRYCTKLLELYNDSRAHISDCQDVLKKIMRKYKRAYKKLLFQKNMTTSAKASFVFYRFAPHLFSIERMSLRTILAHIIKKRKG